MASKTLRIGDAMPVFTGLPGADGKQYSDRDFAGADVLVVVFSCNHCPYVQAYEGRMVDLQGRYAARGVRLVAVNSNETVNYPEDNFNEMVKRAKDQGFNFAYLRDEDQKAAGAFGATHTPEFFVFDKARKLRYHGKMDDNWKEPGSVKEHYLRDAVESVLKGTAVAVPETFSIGCTIKWK